MRMVICAAMLLALSGVALGDGFVDRQLPLSEVLALLPGQEGGGWGDEAGEGWGGVPTEEEEPARAPAPGAPVEEQGPGGGLKIHVQLGGIVPMIAKEEEYKAGFDLALGLVIGLRSKFPSWIRPTLDMGFTSAEGDNWDSSSTLLLFNCDVGFDFMKTQKARGALYGSLGVGVEMLSGEQRATSGARESVTQTNSNLLGGFGALLAFALSEKVDLGFDLRLSFPLGSQNVQGILLIGVNLGIKL